MGKTNVDNVASVIEQVPTVHVIQGTGTSISTDGKVAMLEFTQPDGRKVAVTLPTSGLAMLGWSSSRRHRRQEPR